MIFPSSLHTPKVCLEGMNFSRFLSELDCLEGMNFFSPFLSKLDCLLWNSCVSNEAWTFDIFYPIHEFRMKGKKRMCRRTINLWHPGRMRWPPMIRRGPQRESNTISHVNILHMFGPSYKWPPTSPFTRSPIYSGRVGFLKLHRRHQGLARSEDTFVHHVKRIPPR